MLAKLLKKNHQLKKEKRKKLNKNFKFIKI